MKELSYNWKVKIVGIHGEYRKSIGQLVPREAVTVYRWRSRVAGHWLRTHHKPCLTRSVYQKLQRFKSGEKEGGPECGAHARAHKSVSDLRRRVTQQSQLLSTLLGAAFLLQVVAEDSPHRTKRLTTFGKTPTAETDPKSKSGLLLFLHDVPVLAG
ncbi:hypothetical protein J6590_014399 [Homalodisca vitripennis]|nr:hypothetical protein J6590_014399 [Homalodisca vitripennis]